MNKLVFALLAGCFSTVATVNEASAQNSVNTERLENHKNVSGIKKALTIEENQKDDLEAKSFLIGGGYTTGRMGRGGSPHYYLAILFDVLHEPGSPYTDAYGRSIPIIRGGVQIPLFQGGGKKQQKSIDY